MSEAMEQSRLKAIEYLRWRGIYILDGNGFKPTSAAGTDVRKTFAAYQKFVKERKKA